MKLYHVFTEYLDTHEEEVVRNTFIITEDINKVLPYSLKDTDGKSLIIEVWEDGKCLNRYGLPYEVQDVQSLFKFFNII